MPYSAVPVASDPKNQKNVLQIEILPTSRFLALSLESPVSGEQTEVSGITIRGWALGMAERVVAVEVLREGIIALALTNVPRQDVARHYPEKPESSMCGFHTTLGLIGMPREFDFIIQAVFLDGTREPFVKVRVTKGEFSASCKPSLTPLLLTSLGRSGSTWLMRLLAEHPGIVAYRKYPYESRISNYCAQTAKVLSEVTNYFKGEYKENIGDMFWGFGYSKYIDHNVEDPLASHHFAKTFQKQMRAFCCTVIDEFYQTVAILQEQRDATYFMEKYLPPSNGHAHTTNIIKEIYPNIREIILVRDFRDMICSVFSFNRKRGFLDFGRDLVDNDEQYVLRVRNGAGDLLNQWRNAQNQAHLLHYEDLIRDPKRSLERALKYLELDHSAAVIDGILERVALSNPELRNHQTTETPGESIGRWQKDLSPTLQILCMDILKDVLTEFGYGQETREPGSYSCFT